MVSGLINDGIYLTNNDKGNCISYKISIIWILCLRLYYKMIDKYFSSSHFETDNGSRILFILKHTLCELRFTVYLVYSIKLRRLYNVIVPVHIDQTTRIIYYSFTELQKQNLALLFQQIYCMGWTSITLIKRETFPRKPIFCSSWRTNFPFPLYLKDEIWFLFLTYCTFLLTWPISHLKVFFCN